MEYINDKISNIKEEYGINSKSIKKLSDYIILLGGASIVSYALRTRFLGKMLRAVEVPHGNLSTIIVRSNSLKALKEAIIKAQPPLYPGVTLEAKDIRTSVFTPPHFSELILSNFQCRCLEEGSYILWTKMELDIPKNGIDLRSFSKETFAKMASDNEKDNAILAITHNIVTIDKTSLFDKLWTFLKKKWNTPKEGEVNDTIARALFPAVRRRELNDITQEERSAIVEILIDDVDSEIVSLASKYKGDPSGFRWHAVNLLRTRTRFTGKV
jgi:hypothetical protein